MKTMWVVSGVAIARVEVSQETDKTYLVANVKPVFGYVSSVRRNSRVRKSDHDKQWFEDRTAALACLLENQRNKIAYLQEQLEKQQARLESEKKRLTEWEAQFIWYEE